MRPASGRETKLVPAAKSNDSGAEGEVGVTATRAQTMPTRAARIYRLCLKSLRHLRSPASEGVLV